MKLFYAIHKCDVCVFTWLVNVRLHRLLSPFCRQISRTGDGWLYGLLLAALYYQQGWQSLGLQMLLLGFLIERPLYFVLKNGLKRHRPAQVLPNFQSVIRPSDYFSFPSGHTSAAFMVATTLAYCLPAWTAPLFIWAASVGFSRVILGVHFPTDILMGMVLGVSAALLSMECLIV